MHGGVGRHPEGKGRLAHGRPGADDDEGGGLQAGELLVDVEVPGRDPGDVLALVVERLDPLEAAVQQLGEDLGGVGDLRDRRPRTPSTRPGRWPPRRRRGRRSRSRRSRRRRRSAGAGGRAPRRSWRTRRRWRSPACRPGGSTRVAGPPMASSSPARRSSSATVTGSAGSPWLCRVRMASKMWPWAGL